MFMRFWADGDANIDTFLCQGHKEILCMKKMLSRTPARCQDCFFRVFFLFFFMQKTLAVRIRLQVDWSSKAEILRHDDDDFRHDVCTLAKLMGHNWHQRTPPYLPIQPHQSTTSISTDTNTEPTVYWFWSIFGALSIATNCQCFSKHRCSSFEKVNFSYISDLLHAN